MVDIESDKEMISLELLEKNLKLLDTAIEELEFRMNNEKDLVTLQKLHEEYNLKIAESEEIYSQLDNL